MIGVPLFQETSMSTACFWISDDECYAATGFGECWQAESSTACTLTHVPWMQMWCALLPFTTRYSTVVACVFLPDWCVAHKHLAPEFWFRTRIWPNKMEARRIRRNPAGCPIQDIRPRMFLVAPDNPYEKGSRGACCAPHMRSSQMVSCCTWATSASNVQRRGLRDVERSNRSSPKLGLCFSARLFSSPLSLGSRRQR